MRRYMLARLAYLTPWPPSHTVWEGGIWAPWAPFGAKCIIGLMDTWWKCEGGAW